MRDERDRAKRLRGEFEELLTQLRQQDEQMNGICGALGVLFEPVVQAEALPAPSHAESGRSKATWSRGESFLVIRG